MNTFEHDALCPCYGIHPWDEDPPECACEGLYCQIHDLFNCWYDHRFRSVDLMIVNMNDGSEPRRFCVRDVSVERESDEGLHRIDTTRDIWLGFEIDTDVVAAWSNIDEDEILENMRRAGIAVWNRPEPEPQPLRPVGEFIEACDSLLNDMYVFEHRENIEYDASGLPIDRSKK